MCKMVAPMTMTITARQSGVYNGSGEQQQDVERMRPFSEYNVDLTLAVLKAGGM